MIFKINKYTKGGKRSQELMMWRAQDTAQVSGLSMWGNGGASHQDGKKNTRGLRRHRCDYNIICEHCIIE